MDRKSNKGKSERPDRAKKRGFCGNQHFRPEDTEYTSTSAKKFMNNEDDEVSIENNLKYCILEFYSVFTTLSALVICASCKEKIKFSEASPNGVGFKIALNCACPRKTYIPSSPMIGKSYEINRRLVVAMRLLGIGPKGITMFCGLMDLALSFSNNLYYTTLQNLYVAGKAMYEHVISKAIGEEKDVMIEANPKCDPTLFAVSGDGTWKKRGFASLFGVTTLIAKHTKKIVDTVVKSSLCDSCKYWEVKKEEEPEAYQIWLDTHDEECTINHEGSSGKMEVDAVIEMFSRSVETHGIKYVKYIGDVI